ncbi:hypothetical protein, partial [Frigidibacter sp. MR17.24]|uniref:hypothetical protein n=1 Tax=Frigidibacter sp. MR17.24 TaxID=3127345 RepID=UPI003012C71E
PLDLAEGLLGDVDLGLGTPVGDDAPADTDLAVDLGPVEADVSLDAAEALIGDVDLAIGGSGGGDLDPSDTD